MKYSIFYIVFNNLEMFEIKNVINVTTTLYYLRIGI